MASKEITAEGKKAPEAKKTYRALGNILGDRIDAGADQATKTLTPFKLHRKGSKIDLSEKDAARLLALGSIEPIK